MESVTLKHSDLTVSRICMGGCPMGGYNWGETNEEDCIDAIHEALYRGVNFFDTADTYGLGRSETILAKGLGSHRNEVVVQTKFGVVVPPDGGQTSINNTPQYLRIALESSLRRLNTDYIDIYVIHYWDRVTPPEEIVGELEKHRKAGKIRYYGLSNIRKESLPLFAPFKDRFANAQHEFSLACRKHEDVIDFTRHEMDTTPLTWGSLGQGILTGKYDENVQFGCNDRRRNEAYVNFHGEKLKHNLRIVDALKSISNNHDKICAATAIRFILDTMPDSVAIVGVKNAMQITENLEALDWHLSMEELEYLKEISKE